MSRYSREIGIVSVVLILCGILLLLCGCSVSTRGRSVTQETTHVTGSMLGAPIEATVTRQMETRDESQADTSSPAIGALMQALPAATGGPVGMLISLAVGAGSAWVASRGGVKSLRDSLTKTEADRDEGWQKAEDNQRRAEGYARQLPPDSSKPLV